MLKGASERPLGSHERYDEFIFSSINRAGWEPFMSFRAHMTHHPLSYANTLVPLERLKANCLKSASRAFLINLVNLARWA